MNVNVRRFEREDLLALAQHFGSWTGALSCGARVDLLSEMHLATLPFRTDVPGCRTKIFEAQSSVLVVKHGQIIKDTLGLLLTQIVGICQEFGPLPEQIKEIYRAWRNAFVVVDSYLH